jgi:NTE family protein
MEPPEREVFAARRRNLGRGTAWVLGGGGARGAAQVGALLAFFEAGVEPPSAIVGASVGALDGATIAASPTLTGARLLQQLWLSEHAREVFHLHPFDLLRSHLAGSLGPLSPASLSKLVEEFESISGCSSFESLRRPLLVVATDIDAGRPVVFRRGPLAPALLASAAIPGLFPPVCVGGREYLDGGIVDNVPISVAVSEGHGTIIAIGLMAASDLERPLGSWSAVIARTLQLSLHQRLLSDFDRLRSRAKIVVICPVTPPSAAWDMKKEHVEALIERSRRATARLIASHGKRLFSDSAIHYLDLDEARERTVMAG